MSALRQDLLFLACTRPAMAMGLPQDALAALVIVCGQVAVWLIHFQHVILAALFCAAAYGVCVALAAYDAHIFGAMFLWLRTSVQASIAADTWGGATVSPTPGRAYRKLWNREAVVGIVVHG